MGNELLRRRRESVLSPSGSGRGLSRTELADAVNDYVWSTTSNRISLNADTISRYERGMISWPRADYREGLRAVLGANT
ncbi:MAG: XRE family transcriptional regulator, partial [Pseudonocardiaceae bacterium]